MSVELGYNSFFEENRKRIGLGDFPVARVVAEFKNAYRVKNEDGEYLAKVTGKQRFEAVSREGLPAVGDWVAIGDLGDGLAVIRGILPRRSLLRRRYGDKDKTGEKKDIQILAANVDVAFVVQSVGRDFSPNRFERYFVLAKDGGVNPVVILNKTDLISNEELDSMLSELSRRFPGIDIIATSAVNNEGLDDLKRHIEYGKTYCFLGSSGVGKSSLINSLLGGDSIRTGEVSSYSGRGKHVTTGRQMYFLENGGIVIDNPGTREVGLVDATGARVTFFDEIARLAPRCRYSDCAHVHEPGCAVREALKAGDLDGEQYSNFLTLKRESDFLEMSSVERREKDRKFGKLLKNAKKQFRDFEP